MQVFLAELKRRKVYRVAIAYAAGAWAILQVADIVLPLVNLPDWSMRFVLLLAAGGFPIALVLAWAFDITPEGVVTTSDIPEEKLHSRPLFMQLTQLLLILLLVAGVGFLYYERLSGSSMITSRLPPLASKSIAVLPFENFSTDPGNRYFSDGISEELLNSLAKVEGLYVTARTSSFHFRDTKLSAIEIGKKLSVSTLLEGSVRKSGNKVRITAQLINTLDGGHMWSETYDKWLTLEDIFDVQEEISERVVDSILPMILDERPEPGKPTTNNAQAYDEYLLGRALLRGFLDDKALLQAEQHFARAINLDSGYAEAYAGKCEALLTLYQRYKRSVDFDNAYTACQSALEKSSTEMTSWDVHLALGILFRESGNFAMSIDHLEKAKSYKPELASSLQEIGITYAAAGDRQKAEAAIKKAISIDPSNWDSYLVLANYLHDLQDYREAITIYNKVLSDIPDSIDALIGKGSALFNIGENTMAEETWLQASELAKERDESALALIYTNLGLLYYYDGSYLEAEEMHQDARQVIGEDHRVYGRIAEAWRALGNDGRKESNYAVAIALAEKELSHNPNDWETLGLLGVYHGFSGLEQQALQYHQQQALQYMARMLDQDSAPATANFFAALIYFSGEHYDAAFDEMGLAVERGFPTALLAKDPDLKQLRITDPQRFDALLLAAEH